MGASGAGAAGRDDARFQMRLAVAQILSTSDGDSAPPPAALTSAGRSPPPSEMSGSTTRQSHITATAAATSSAADAATVRNLRLRHQGARAAASERRVRGGSGSGLPGPRRGIRAERPCTSLMTARRLGRSNGASRAENSRSVAQAGVGETSCRASRRNCTGSAWVPSIKASSTCAAWATVGARCAALPRTSTPPSEVMSTSLSSSEAGGADPLPCMATSHSSCTIATASNHERGVCWSRSRERSVAEDRPHRRIDEAGPAHGRNPLRAGGSLHPAGQETP